MTVSAEFRVDVRPYSGYDDPSLPIAAWISQGGLAGDVSGGSIFMDFLFQRADDAQVTELFNLEQLSVDTSAESPSTFMLSTLTMDNLAPNRPASPQKWKGDTSSVVSASSSATPLFNVTILPLWLGAPNKVEGNGGLRLQTVNTNGVLVAATLQGYMWGPRSVLAPGGPRRPVGGLFGP